MKLLSKKIRELYEEFPETKKLFSQISLPVISEEMSLEEFFSSLSVQFFRDSGLTKDSVLLLIENIVNESKNQKNDFNYHLESLKVSGGFDKDGKKEDFTLDFRPGDIYAVTGLTGSGKTQFLEDIEYIASGDSPSRRKILINGKEVTEEERENLENRLCSSLSQSMNFVLELSSEDFILMHADCRKKNLSPDEKENLINQVIECANSLAGEKISRKSVITQLSGGQSRALMISDIALISDSPVVLIDEPENAGIDKDKILNLLSSKGKIVLVSTHDPIIALSCPKRIVIKNGAVSSILEQTDKEKNLLAELKKYDEKMTEARNLIREGKNVC